MLCCRPVVIASQIPTGESERAYRRRVRAWSFYDWANHGYVTVTATTFFPPYFIAIAAPAFLARGGAAALARDTASNVYALTVSLALLVAAVLAPLIGTVADVTGRRKRMLVGVTLVGGCLASSMAAIGPGDWRLALGLYLATQIAVNVALGLNSSLLPHVAQRDDLNRASSLGYAMGYVGGGLLLALATALYFAAPSLGVDRGVAVRLAFGSVGVWWIAFALPMALAVPEPPALPLAHGARGGLHDAVVRLGHTLRDLHRYRELFTMLLAFWLYMEGIGAIILLATAYGAALGLSTGVLTGTLLMTQFVAFPYAMLFARTADPASRWRAAIVSMLLWTAITLPALGAATAGRGGVGTLTAVALIIADQALGAGFSLALGARLCRPLAERLDTRRAVMLGLAIYTVVPIWGLRLSTEAEFVMLGWLVGTVQGGTQALSRSIVASLSPRAKSGEFFGIFGLAEKFAGILGPLLYGLVGEITHDPRASVASTAIFFLAGLAVLARVDVAAGAAAAAAEESEIAATGASD
jgi:MFS transporter, UMF1 family